MVTEKIRGLHKQWKKKLPIFSFILFLILLLTGFSKTERVAPFNPLLEACTPSAVYISENPKEGKGQNGVSNKSRKEKEESDKEKKIEISDDESLRAYEKAVTFQNTMTEEGEEAERVYFVTTIQDGSVLNSREYAFSIIQKTKLSVLSLQVYINGRKQIQFHGPVLLDEGKNIVRVSVVYKKADGKLLTVFQDYTLYVKLPETKNSSISDTPKTPTPDETLLPTPTQTPIANEFEIETDLKEKTVHKDSIRFYAKLNHKTEKAKLTVACNGKLISGDNGNYQTSLNTGKNLFLFKGTDIVEGKKVSVRKTVTVTYVPLATEETAPSFTYINVQDGMNIRGTSFVLNLQPVDYKGNRIYQDTITVRLNDVICQYRWISEYTSYLLELQNGKNVLSIRLTDRDGRFADFSYVINCTAVKDGESLGEITLSIDANVLGLGYLVEPKKVTIYQGDTAAETITKFLQEEGFTYQNIGTVTSGFYLTRIEKKGIAADVNIPEELISYINEDGLDWKEECSEDSIGEFDYCQGSGWMYDINGAFPGNGITDAVLKDGDVVRLRYTLAYGKDIGGYTITDNGEKNYDKTW